MRADGVNGLSSFFEPTSVAVFGSVKGDKFAAMGGALGAIKNMREFGFKGKIHPISQSGGDAFGLTAYTNIDKVSEPIDLAMLLIPPQAVPDVINQCVRKGIRSIIINTENFAEAGEDGAKLQKQVVDIIRSSGIRALGPNTLGVLNPSCGLVTTPYVLDFYSVLKGGIGYGSQSGLISFGGHPLKDKGYPISKLCDFGNKCDVNEIDLLEYFYNDPETKVVSMYLEDIKDSRAFMHMAKKVVAKKPVIIFKSGRSQAGAKAAASHTGSLAGNDLIYESAFKQAGVIRVNTMQEFWEVPKVFASQPLPKGNRCAIVSATGGGGVICTDAAVREGLESANFTSATLEKLAGRSPRLAHNPVDMGPVLAVVADPFPIIEDIVFSVLSDVNVDCATLVLPGISESIDMFKHFKPRITDLGKPITVYLYGLDLSVMEETMRQLIALGIPTYLDPEIAVKSLGISVKYSRIKSRTEKI